MGRGVLGELRVVVDGTKRGDGGQLQKGSRSGHNLNQTAARGTRERQSGVRETSDGLAR